MFKFYINRFFEVRRYFDLTVRVAIVLIGMGMIMTVAACETLDRAYTVERTTAETSKKVQRLEHKLDSITKMIRHEKDSL